MPIKLDNPKVKFEATDNAVTRVVLELPHTTDPGNGSLSVDTTKAHLKVFIAPFDESGKPAWDESLVHIPFLSWTPQLQSAIENVIKFIEDGGHAGQGNSSPPFNP